MTLPQDYPGPSNILLFISTWTFRLIVLAVLGATILLRRFRQKEMVCHHSSVTKTTSDKLLPTLTSLRNRK
ncbi:hypothetical protein F5880DRAFT_1698404 [Lentinula raphanica]|nr:hypothetical protein F5880DRAFT_1698404 [Lentinula raphanica]